VLLTQAETAKLLRVSERTLERWRLEGGAIPFVKLGKRVLDACGDRSATALLERHRVTPCAIALAASQS